MNDLSPMHTDRPLTMQWGGLEAGEDGFGAVAWWLGGGGMLLAWTAIALLLTSA